MIDTLEEKIIFSHQFNEAELLRTFSKNNHNTFLTRVLNDLDICLYILSHLGITINKKYINDNDESFIYYKILGGIFDDAKNIKNAINSFRDSSIINTLDNMDKILLNEYKLKKDTIINAYKAYIEYKNNNNLYDKHDMIEYIINNNLKIKNVNVIYFKEYNISNAFLKMLNNVFDNVNEISISFYFDFKKPNIEIIKAYGKENEIKNIYNKINELNINLDKCQIILTNPKDIIELISINNIYNIEYTSKIGIPFIASKPAILLKCINDMKKGNYGVDAYKLLFNLDVFNKEEYINIFTENDKLNNYKYNDFIKYAGWLRIGFENDTVINDSLYDKKIAKALNMLYSDMKLGIVEFIKKYVIDDIYNQIAINKMEDLINYKKKYDIDIDDISLLNSLFNTYIAKEVSKEKALHITTIDSAFESLREYNFIVGLDDEFPGNPKENYLIFDDEYIKLNAINYTSYKLTEFKLNRCLKLIELSNNVILSYCYYSLLDLKEKNPSSIIYDLKNEGIIEEEFNYLKDNLLENNKIIEARINNKKAIVNNDHKKINYSPDYLLNKHYSPSAIHSFFENKLQFILLHIYGINIDDKDDPFNIIPPNVKGTLVHKFVEGFNKNKISEDDFIKNGIKELEKFFEIKPLIIEDSKNKIIEDFKTELTNLYNLEKSDRECVEYEKTIDDVVISGIKFKGTFDRIEKTKNGDYILVDYKTGRDVTHKENDVESCLQGLIYSYMILHTNNEKIKSKGIRIKRIEFRYTKANLTVGIDYNIDNENKMLEKIEEFKNALINHDFKCLDLENYSYVDKYKKLISLFKEVTQ